MTEKPWPYPEIRHGTAAGYAAHLRRKETPCEACQRAQKKYNKVRLQNPDAQQRNRAFASAQQKAYKRLSKKYRADYRAFYEEERDNELRRRGLPLPGQHNRKQPN